MAIIKISLYHRYDEKTNVFHMQILIKYNSGPTHILSQWQLLICLCHYVSLKACSMDVKLNPNKKKKSNLQCVSVQALQVTTC